MLTKLDHIALVVRELEPAIANYAALLGCQPTSREHYDGAEHAWFQLGNIALDIVAPIGAGHTAGQVRSQLDQYGEGIWAIAFATSDIAKAKHVLERRGISSTDMQLMRSRKASVLASAATHGTTIFLIEQAPAATTSPTNVGTNSTVSGLDHVVITTPQPERATALYGARLGLEMKLDRTNPDWGSRLMFFKCGDLVVEIAHDLKKGIVDGPDHAWGLSWRVPDIAATHARLVAGGFKVSDVRSGRKPGTQVFTVRERNANVPTIVIGKSGEHRTQS